MLSAELRQDQVPTIFKRFRSEVGESTWMDVASAVHAEIAVKPYLKDVLVDQYRVVLALEECSLATAMNGGRMPWALPGQNRLLEAFVFMWHSVQLLDAARAISNKRAIILRARLVEALRSPRMLQAMQLEAQVATHFVVAGKRVLFPELGNGREKFDLLVEDLGPKGLEIECKVVTYDKGRKIHWVEARECLTRLQNSAAVQAAVAQPGAGLGVRLTLPARLPPKEELGEFCRVLDDAIASGFSGALPDGTNIQLTRFEACRLSPLTRPLSSQTEAAIEQILGPYKGHLLVFAPDWAKTGGVVVILLESEQLDSMLHEVFETYADSAGRQLTGERPGALFSIFQGLGRGELESVTRDEGKNGNYSGLAWAASAFLERTEYPHVVGVGFLSEPDYTNHRTAAGGLAYWIPKPVSPLWSPDFSGLFGSLRKAA